MNNSQGSCSMNGQCGGAGSPQCSGPCCQSSGGCNCGSSCGSGGCDPMSEMMEAVKCAKKCLMKDKLKTRIEAKMGKKMDQIADLMVEAYLGKKAMMQEGKAKKMEAMQKLQDIMDA